MSASSMPRKAEGPPSWAVPGQKVICVDPTGAYIAKGGIYTISWVGMARGVVDKGYGLQGISVHLLEVDRPFGLPYAVERFRPLITEKDDLEAYFYQHLKPGHSTTPRKVEERA